MDRRHFNCRDRVDLAFCIKSPFLNKMTDELLSPLAILHMHKPKDVYVDSGIIKIAQKKSGGASPCVCKQYQLTKATCKLPQYQLKECKIGVLAKMAKLETFLRCVHFQEVGIEIFRFGKFF